MGGQPVVSRDDWKVVSKAELWGLRWVDGKVAAKGSRSVVRKDAWMGLQTADLWGKCLVEKMVESSVGSSVVRMVSFVVVLKVGWLGEFVAVQMVSWKGPRTALVRDELLVVGTVVAMASW